LATKKKITEESRESQNPENKMTMEELLAIESFSPRTVRRGEVIEGIVVAVNPSEVLVDIGGKSEGVISSRELGDGTPSISVGDKILAYVLQSEDESGQALLSVKRAGGEKRWRELQEGFNSADPIDVKGLEINRGGLVVDLGGVRGFIPSSQLDSSLVGSKGIGRSFKAKIIELDRKTNRLILSQRALTAEVAKKRFEEASERYHEDDELTGRVSGVMPYGLFVTIEDGLEGLVHISEVSWDRVSNLADLFKIGDEVKVKVLSIDPSAGRVNLSVRSLTHDPWKERLGKYAQGTAVHGKVSKLTQYGVFVELERGVEGLVHSSKIPAYMVDIKPGQEMDLIVESINPDARRISLIVDEADHEDVKPIEELVDDSFKEEEKT
jgi:small subunit ribosomal protein S1